MNKDNYISEYELEQIRREYAEKIIEFSDIKQEVQVWYQNFGLLYPFCSINNYRDSWFHYRKIWRERSFYEIICQTATFDEHIQRAEKDAVVNFFQIISENLEYWYNIDKNITIEVDEEIKKDIQLIFEDDIKSEKSKTYQIWEKYEKDEKLAICAIIYSAKQYVLSLHDIKRKIQKILHMIKNITLKIRMGSSDIQRIEKPGDYLNAYKDCYVQLKGFFDKEEHNELLFLLGITDVIRAGIDIYSLDSTSHELGIPEHFETESTFKEYIQK